MRRAQGCPFFTLQAGVQREGCRSEEGKERKRFGRHGSVFLKRGPLLEDQTVAPFT